MKKKIVFLTGSGISALSGIPTFRDSDTGLWYNHKVEDVATYSGWKKDPQQVLDFYNLRNVQLNTVEPNLAHRLITELENDFDITVVTQNVDPLHERAGNSNVIHLHGQLDKMCSSIDKELTLDYVNPIKLGDLHEDGSQLRPFIVWFGEDVPMMGRAIKAVRHADIVVIIGTSLQVYPAAGLKDYAKWDADKYYIDPEPSEDVDEASIKIIKEIATEGMKQLVEILKNKYINRKYNQDRMLDDYIF